jgi:ribosome maturation factor RimP
MSTSTKAQTQLDRARLDAVVGPVVRAHGGEVVDVEWKQEPGGWVLRVYVEKLGSADSNATTADAAVSLELCAGVARDLSPALDVADFIPHHYNLEVSSPGVERPLRDARDYARFVGQKAKLKVREAVDGQKVVTGVIEQADLADHVALREGSRLRVLPLDQVLSARLVFEFGPAPRPGKGTKPGKPGGPAKVAKAAKAHSAALLSNEAPAPSKDDEDHADHEGPLHASTDASDHRKTSNS